MRFGAGPGDWAAVGRKPMVMEHEGPSKHGQITECRLSDRRGGETIPVTVKFEYCRRRFEVDLGIVGKKENPVP